MKPTALKELTGTARPDRLNPSEPRLSPSLPDRPAWVDDDPLCAQLFDEVANFINNMGISTRVDALGVSLLSDQLATYLRLREVVQREGSTLLVETAAGGQPRVHPALKEMSVVFNAIVKLLREYGLTPASRGNVSTLAEDTNTNFESFLMRRKGG